jgi:O-antigen/teichoic acid export membrane protein
VKLSRLPGAPVISQILGSDSMRGAISFATGGAGFAVANLVLAAALPTTAFAIVTLVLAFNQFGSTCGPLGLDVVVIRHKLAPDLRLASCVAVASGIVGILLGAVVAVFYRLPLTESVLLSLSIVGSGTTRVAAALFQADGRTGPALNLTQLSNYLLLLVAGVALGAGFRSATFVIVVVVAGYLLSALFGWRSASRVSDGNRPTIDVPVALREGMAVVGIGLAVQLLWQFERMVIPVLGSLEDLATYAVLAAIVASPFRMLQFGVMFTLLPSLRSATDAASAKTILRREVGTAVAVALVSIVVIALVAPFILHHLLGGKYVIGRDLILAAVLVGLLRVWAGFSTTVVSALGSVQRIAQISGLGWLSLGVALAGAWLGSRYGLLGVILGTGAGWGVLVTAGTYLAVRSFRSRFADASA